MMPARIKVAQLVLNLDLGGLERLVVNFLSQISQKEFDITVGTLEGPGDLAAEVLEMGIPIATFGRREGIDLKLIPAIAKWLKKERADILHTHNSAAHFYGSLAARTARVRAVIHTKHGRDWPDKPRKVLLNRISSCFTTRVVTVSKNARDVARNIEKVPAKKLVVIHNGIDTEKYNPLAGTELPVNITGMNPDSLVMGTVARLSPEKDQKTMLKAFEMVCRRSANIHLVIAGEGPSRRELEACASGLTCSGKITFLGAVDDIPSLLGKLDIFVLTSLTEGIPLALLEAAAAGIPAVVTDVGGNSEVVVDGVTGFVVTPGSPESVAAKIELLINDRALRASAGKKARERIVAGFSLKGMTSQYESLYRESLGRY